MKHGGSFEWLDFIIQSSEYIETAFATELKQFSIIYNLKHCPWQ